MHVIGHDDKADALCLLDVQRIVQRAQQDPFGVFECYELTPFVAGERDEMCVKFLVVDFSGVGHFLHQLNA